MNTSTNNPQLFDTNFDVSTEYIDWMQRQCVMVQVGLRNYGAEKQDKALSHELAATHQADARAYKVIKSLLKDEPLLDECKKAHSRVRTRLYALTMPYSLASPGANKVGPRLLPLNGVHDGKGVDGMVAMKMLKQAVLEAQAAREALCAEWDTIVARQANTLGDTFDPADYPTVDQLRKLFHAEVTYSPVPDVASFDNLALPPEAARALAQAAAAKMQRQMTNALEDVIKKALDELESFHKTFDAKANEKKGASVYHTVPQRISTVATLLQAANFSNNPDITDVVEKLKSEFVPVTLEEMKNSPDTCARLADHTRMMASKLRPIAEKLETRDGAIVPTAPAPTTPAPASTPEATTTPAPVDEPSAEPEWGEATALGGQMWDVGDME